MDTKGGVGIQWSFKGKSTIQRYRRDICKETHRFSRGDNDDVGFNDDEIDVEKFYDEIAVRNPLLPLWPHLWRWIPASE